MTAPDSRSHAYTRADDAVPSPPAITPATPGYVRLEDATPDAEAGGWTYEMADPVLRIEASSGSNSGSTHAQAIDRAGSVVDQGELFGLLRRLLSQVAEVVAAESDVGDENRPPFRGGVAGYLGYELGHALLGTPSAPNDLGLPVAQLGLYDRVIASRPNTPPRAYTLRTPFDITAASASAAEPTLPAATAEPLASEPTPWPDVRSTHSPAAYRSAVATIIEAIRNGDLFQANLTQRLAIPLPGDTDPFAAYVRMRDRVRPAFGAFLRLDAGTHIASLSPERLLRTYRQADGTHVAEAQPIKGTRPRDHADAAADAALADELRRSVKDRAENLMIVDLLRNDLSRIAKPFGVSVPELAALHSYPAVHHLVSTIRATLRDDCDALDCLLASFPGGSITGAPKEQAMIEIARHEPVARGPYCGSIGWIRPDGVADFNIAIRTAVLRGNTAYLGVGGGITARSDPADEYRESLDKAHALLEAITTRTYPTPAELEPQGQSRERERPNTVDEPAPIADPYALPRTPNPSPPADSQRDDTRPVVVIDNHDSFVFNLVRMVEEAGCRAIVARNDEIDVATIAGHNPLMLLLSPGPCGPREAGVCIDAVRSLGARIPIVGVCLGHQAIVAAHGGDVVRGEPVHGIPWPISHHARGPFAGWETPIAMTRYHSLIADPATLPACLEELAWCHEEQGGARTIMAVQHRSQPTLGLQFHPESIASERGDDLIRRCLAAAKAWSDGPLFSTADTPSATPDGSPV